MRRSAGLVFETHSLTVDNERGIATGWLGGTLSLRGRELAGELGARRRADGIQAVHASDLARAVETVEIAFEGSGIPIELDWRLREIDYGELNGAPVAVLERERALRIDRRFPGGESYRDTVARVADFLEGVSSDERILVIGHTATRWALDHLLAGEELESVVTRPFDWRPGWEYTRGPRRFAAAGAPA
jgi:broad specificity phosphatase PhoE